MYDITYLYKLQILYTICSVPFDVVVYYMSMRALRSCTDARMRAIGRPNNRNKYNNDNKFDNNTNTIYVYIYIYIYIYNSSNDSNNYNDTQ